MSRRGYGRRRRKCMVALFWNIQPWQRTLFNRVNESILDRRW